MNLAWAIKSNHVRLSARLEAYVETKPAISTFVACIAHSTVPSMSNLPLEIVTLISDELKDLAYIPKVQRAVRAEECVHNRCEQRDHFTKHELYSLCDECYGTKYEYECLEEDSMERHDNTVDTYLRKLTHTKVAKENKRISEFARCKEVSHIPVSCKSLLYR